MADWRDRRAVITGAASGIGRSFSKLFAAQGMEVFLADVDPVGLAAVADDLRAGGARVHHTRLDVRDAEAFRSWAAEIGGAGPVDVLVNNAGVAVGGPIARTPTADWDHVVSVNLLGVVYGCAAFLPWMLQNPRRAHVVILSSASGYGGTPGLGAYSVTKVAVKAYAEVLAAESDPARLAVHCVLPGFVPTNILDHARLNEADPESARARARAAFFPRDRHPDQVAAATLAAMERGQLVVPVYRESHLARLLSKLPDGAQGWARRKVWARFRAVSDTP